MVVIHKLSLPNMIRWNHLEINCIDDCLFSLVVDYSLFKFYNLTLFVMKIVLIHMMLHGFFNGLSKHGANCLNDSIVHSTVDTNHILKLKGHLSCLMWIGLIIIEWNAKSLFVHCLNLILVFGVGITLCFITILKPHDVFNH